MPFTDRRIVALATARASWFENYRQGRDDSCLVALMMIDFVVKVSVLVWKSERGCEGISAIGVLLQPERGTKCRFRSLLSQG